MGEKILVKCFSNEPRLQWYNEDLLRMRRKDVQGQICRCKQIDKMVLFQIAAGELRSLINRSDKERSELQRRVEQHEISERLKIEREAEDRQRLAGLYTLDYDKQHQMENSLMVNRAARF